MKKRFLAILMVLALCLSIAPAAFADASVSYKGSADKFVFTPGSEYSPTDLFENFKDVMPGDTLTQQIEVKNDVKNDVKIKLYMRALGADANSEGFLNQMDLTVKAADGSELFAAPAGETAQLTDWVCLGTFYSGAKTTLDVTLNVPIEMGNDYANQIGTLDWEFAVEELPVEPTDPVGPKTGDDTPVALYAAICAVCAGAVVFLFATRKKKEQ
ncbi:MAG: LPXTG cell wall anchor domain-containing protein [Firmicutes bacterium]|nr:LPXTG cell wall anchor domain-containing protein [Bacillota bacterium]